jgi:hypothetical protein
MTKNRKKFTAEKKIFTYPWASIENVLVTEEAFSPKKRSSRTSKHEISKCFILLWVIFALLDRSGYGSSDLIESETLEETPHIPYIQFENLIIFLLSENIFYFK